MQAAQTVALPNSLARSGPTWSDYKELYEECMSKTFLHDPASRQLSHRMSESEKTITQLTDRLHNDTDEDLYQLTQKKLRNAHTELEHATKEFKGSQAGEYHSIFSKFSLKFDGPECLYC